MIQVDIYRKLVHRRGKLVKVLMRVVVVQRLEKMQGYYLTT